MMTFVVRRRRSGTHRSVAVNVIRQIDPMLPVSAVRFSTKCLRNRLRPRLTAMAMSISQERHCSRRSARHRGVFSLTALTRIRLRRPQRAARTDHQHGRRTKPATGRTRAGLGLTAIPATQLPRFVPGGSERSDHVAGDRGDARHCRDHRVVSSSAQRHAGGSSRDVEGGVTLRS